MKRLFWRAIAIVTLAVPVALAAIPSTAPLWHREITAPPNLTPTAIFLISIVIGALAVRFLRSSTWFIGTLVHELGHSLMAALVGGIPVKITMKRDGSGLAFYDFNTYPRNWKLRTVAISAAGYAAPGFTALSAAYAINHDNAYLWVVFTAILLIALVIGLARSTTVIIVALIVIAGIGSALWWAPWSAPGVAGLFATIWALGGIRAARGQLRAIGRTPCDAAHIEQATHIPARIVGRLQILLAFVLTIWAGLVAFP